MDPVNHSGGIAVLWNNDGIHASLLSKSQRALHLLVHDTGNNQNVILTGVYAPAQSREKEFFWNQLLQFSSVVDLPWCLIGDFNELASPGEKMGGVSYPLSKYDRLNNFTNNINAISIPYKGKCFTWKKRIRTHLIYERLDRAIARSDWMNLYSDSFVTHGQFTCSDHCPIFLSTANPIHRRKSFPFRFQNAWCQYR